MQDDGGLTARAERRWLEDQLQQLRAGRAPAQARRFAAGVYTLQEAALLLALHLEKGEEWHKALLADLVRTRFDHGRDGFGHALPLRHPTLERPLSHEERSDLRYASTMTLYQPEYPEVVAAGPLVKREDVNQWLRCKGYPCRWVERRPASAPAPAAAAAAPAAAPAPTVVVAESAGTTVSKGALVKRRDLITRHQRLWPTVYRDLKDASTNGLSQAAKSHGHGVWYEGAALDWAKANGKLGQPVELPNLVHRLPR